MAILTWNLSTAPAQTPEYWLLFVDGFAWCSLGTVAPYVGIGAYSVDLDAVQAREALAEFATPLSPGPHQFSVALVGDNSVGPQSPSVSVTIAAPVALPTPPASPVLVWPTADSLATSPPVQVTA